MPVNTDMFLTSPDALQMPRTAQMPGMWSHERAAWRAGFRLVSGVDEAGRGPLAGPVVAAAVILPSDFDPTGIADSKTLTHEERVDAYTRIMNEAHCVGVGVVGREIIDRLNILKASQMAMVVAIEDMGVRPEICLVDGLRVPQIPYPQIDIVKGDSKSVSIAAASIVAKVTRDDMMCDLDRKYPGYGFARHKGYATVEHLQALSELGVCPEHRMTFKPCSGQKLEPCLILDTNTT